VSYGKRACDTFATNFPTQTSRLTFDSNSDLTPGVNSIAEEDPMGPMAVFRGTTTACEATLIADDKKVLFPLAPFMGETLHNVLNGREHEERNRACYLEHICNEKNVPCSAVMTSCMSWVLWTHMDGLQKNASLHGGKMQLASARLAWISD